MKICKECMWKLCVFQYGLHLSSLVYQFCSLVRELREVMHTGEEFGPDDIVMRVRYWDKYHD
jgi:hypothetical protein